MSKRDIGKEILIPAPPSFPRRRESTTAVDPRLRGDDDGIFFSATSLRPPYPHKGQLKRC